MNKPDKKQLKKAYLETPLPMGIVCIENTITGCCYLVAAMDTAGAVNSHRFRLETGTHECKPMQQAYNQNEKQHFTFSVIDTLSPSQDTRKTNYKDELRELLEIWENNYREKGTPLYSNKNLTNI